MNGRVRVLAPSFFTGVAAVTDWLKLTVKRQSDASPVVLIVDDEAGVRELWERAVAALGYHTILAADAETAMRLLPQEPHVALVDVRLPGASGLWLADHIRIASPTTAIIFATGDTRIPATETLRPHVTAYLVKPFSPDTLQNAVEKGIQWSEAQRHERQ